MITGAVDGAGRKSNGLAPKAWVQKCDGSFVSSVPLPPDLFRDRVAQSGLVFTHRSDEHEVLKLQGPGLLRSRFSHLEHHAGFKLLNDPFAEGLGCRYAILHIANQAHH